MSERIILNSAGIVRGPAENGLQFYGAVGIDKEGQEYLIGFAAKLVYQESIEKSFTRLHPVPAEKEVQEAVTVNTEGKESGNGRDQAGTIDLIGALTGKKH
jgi:hypothetical protein